MGRATGTGDDDLEALVARGGGEIDHAQGGAVGGNDARLIVDPEGFERFSGKAHRGPVRLAAHDNGNRRGCHHEPVPPGIVRANCRTGPAFRFARSSLGGELFSEKRFSGQSVAVSEGGPRFKPTKDQAGNRNQCSWPSSKSL